MTSQTIMNISTTPSTPDSELLRKAVKGFRRVTHRIPFNNLKPFHDSIVELRGKSASYAAIADLLKQNGVKTSLARVAEYGRIVLNGGKPRKRRNLVRTAHKLPMKTPPNAVAANNAPPPSRRKKPAKCSLKLAILVF
jgi:hypothetical protein